MKRHIKVYLQEMGYGEQDYKLCEICEKAEATDVHHINPRGMGGSPEKDVAGNLTGLCRHCHDIEENRIPESPPHTKEWLMVNHVRFKNKHHIS